MTTHHKALIAAALCGLLLLAVLLQAQTETTKTGTGRYQLVAATFENNYEKPNPQPSGKPGFPTFPEVSAHQIPTVFKIDTTTGKVWVFTTGTFSDPKDPMKTIFQDQWRLTN